MKTVFNTDKTTNGNKDAKLKQVWARKTKLWRSLCDSFKSSHPLVVGSKNVTYFYTISTLISLTMRFITVPFLLSRDILTPLSVNLVFFLLFPCHIDRVSIKRNKMTSRGRQLHLALPCLGRQKKNALRHYVLSMPTTLQHKQRQDSTPE